MLHKYDSPGSMLGLLRHSVYHGCSSQDELSYPVVTNSSQISVASNIKGLFLSHTMSHWLFGEGSTPHCPHVGPRAAEPPLWDTPGPLQQREQSVANPTLAPRGFCLEATNFC